MTWLAAFGILVAALLAWIAWGVGVSLYRSRKWPEPTRREVSDPRD